MRSLLDVKLGNIFMYLRWLQRDLVFFMYVFYKRDLNYIPIVVKSFDSALIFTMYVQMNDMKEACLRTPRV